MDPKKCAYLLVEVAKRFPIFDAPNAVDEVIYVLAWYLWDMANGQAPKWTDALGRELDRSRPGITRKGFHERFTAYNAAKANGEGGLFGLDIARTFQLCVLGAIPLDGMQTIELWHRLAGLMYGLGKAL